MKLKHKFVSVHDGLEQVVVRIIPLPFGLKGMVHRPLDEDHKKMWAVSEYSTGRRICQVHGPMSVAITQATNLFLRAGEEFSLRSITSVLKECGYANR